MGVVDSRFFSRRSESVAGIVRSVVSKLPLTLILSPLRAGRGNRIVARFRLMISEAAWSAVLASVNVLPAESA